MPRDRFEPCHDGRPREGKRNRAFGYFCLFGFLLAIRFTEKFDTLTLVQERVYYATLLSTAFALVMLLAPAAFHRIRFREGDKEVMLRKGNREAIAGTGGIALAFTGVIFLITDLMFSLPWAFLVAASFFLLAAWRWWLIALYREAKES